MFHGLFGGLGFRGVGFHGLFGGLGFRGVGFHAFFAACSLEFRFPKPSTNSTSFERAGLTYLVYLRRIELVRVDP